MNEGNAFLDRVMAVFSAGLGNPRSADTSWGYADPWWQRNVAAAAGVAARLEAKAPARILDLACGCGSSTAALALMGFDVTAIDCTPGSIEIARRMSAEKGAAVKWLCQDMRQIDYREAFDYVCLRDVIFGIFETAEEDNDLIRRIALAAKCGGRCLFEAYNKEFSLRHGVEDTLVYDAATDRFVRRDANPTDLSMHLYSHDEWRQMLGEHGLEIVKMDGWKWAKDPAPPPWRADIIVARKGLASICTAEAVA